MQVDGNIDGSTASLDGGKVEVNGEMFDQVILATGAAMNPMGSPLYQQVASEFGASTLDGFPLLDDSLRWEEEEDLFVVGANAMLQVCVHPFAPILLTSCRRRQTD